MKIRGGGQRELFLEVFKNGYENIDYHIYCENNVLVCCHVHWMAILLNRVCTYRWCLVRSLCLGAVSQTSSE